MTSRKTRPLVYGKIVVWPVIPARHSGVKLHDQAGAQDARWPNVVVLPVIARPRPGEPPEWMRHVVINDPPPPAERLRAIRRRPQGPPKLIEMCAGKQFSAAASRRMERARERLREVFNHRA